MSFVSDSLRAAAIFAALSQAGAKVYTGVTGANYDVVLTARYDGKDQMTMDYDCGGPGRTSKGSTFTITLWEEIESMADAVALPSSPAAPRKSGGSGSIRSSLVGASSRKASAKESSLTRSESSSSLTSIYDRRSSSSGEEELQDIYSYKMEIDKQQLEQFKKVCGDTYGKFRGEDMTATIKDNEIDMGFLGTYVKLLRGRAPPLLGSFKLGKYAEINAKFARYPEVELKLSNGRTTLVSYTPQTKDDGNERLYNVVARDVRQNPSRSFLKEGWMSFLKTYTELSGSEFDTLFDDLTWDSVSKGWHHQIPLEPMSPKTST